MTSSRLVRGTKTRMFAFICLIFVLGALVYIFHGTQTRLSEIQQQAGICSQQLESLNAQMQVILEYKLRLATTLNKEKEDHRQTKDLLEKKIKEAKEKWDKESLENKNKYDALIQKNNILQGQLEDSKEKMNEIDEEKKKIQRAHEELKKTMENNIKKHEESKEHLKTQILDRDEEIRKLKKSYLDLNAKALPEENQNNFLEKQNYQLQNAVEEYKTKLSECENKPPLTASPSPKSEAKSVGAQPDTNVGEMPKLAMGVGKNNTSTPGINPMALGDVSSVKPMIEADVDPRKPGDHLSKLSKKPTEESVLPLVQPGKILQDSAQIPGPPNHRTNTLQKPKTNDRDLDQEPMNNNIIADEPEDSLLHDQQMKGQLREPFMPLHGIGGVAAAGMDVEGQQPQPAVAGDRDEEEEGGGEVNINNQVQPKNQENYHGGDYDKEQPEEDDEGEQIDYEADRSVKDGKVKLVKSPKLIGNRNGGIMIIPK